MGAQHSTNSHSYRQGALIPSATDLNRITFERHELILGNVKRSHQLSRRGSDRNRKHSSVRAVESTENTTTTRELKLGWSTLLCKVYVNDRCQLCVRGDCCNVGEWIHLHALVKHLNV